MITAITEPLIAQTLELAAQWQQRANKMRSAEEKIQQEQLGRLLAHTRDKVVLAKLFDQGFRSRDQARVADQINYLLQTHGIPFFFSASEKALIMLFRSVGRHLPSLSIPTMIAKMRQSSRHLIIPGEADALHAHLENRKNQGVQVNINHLGEAVLGEREARRRLKAYLKDLADPLVEYISVKISTLYSQIQPLAFEHSVQVLSERLATLFAAAQQQYFVRADGSRASKFVNLDMEEYRDLHITVEAFKRTLDKPEFQDYSAGIVLQAYLPDAFAIQQELSDWAARRVAAGGASIKIRIVKGANLEMERIEAALYNWPLAPFDNKRDVDANYKRMLLFGLQPRQIHAVHLGVASHNLFELAFAYQVAKANGVLQGFVFEMLEGMADHVRKALRAMEQPLLLYAPVAGEAEFLNAIAYLIRRMDENTGPENFLRYAPHLKTGSQAWQRLEKHFVESCQRIEGLSDLPHRRQNRLNEDIPENRGTLTSGEFANEPDTDWSLAPNRQWARQIRERWEKRPQDEPLLIPLVVADQTIQPEHALRCIVDPNQVPEKICVAQYAQAGQPEIELAVSTAREDPDGWRKLRLEARHAVLSRVAQELRRARGDLIGAAAAETGKLFGEADSEVSEAVDFAEYYPFSAAAFMRHTNLEIRGKGVGVVVSPWNFPIAIPAGGLLAALAAGNTVIFKPASNAVLTAWTLCRIFWEAGVSRNTLQFIPCDGTQAGKHLISNPQVDFVILTGGTQTGLQILQQRPDLFLAAETGGKNSTIVTAMADREQAIQHVIHSAFGHGGQKCSATSLLILEKEVYQDPEFKLALVDAASSLPVGSAWDFQNRMGPLIRPPAGALQRALGGLEPGESWALEPRNLNGNPHLWTPGIKWGVQPGSFTHLTELFGPLLGVMRAADLEEAVELANQTGYGLTGGIESLDPREVARWKATLRAGNLYVNRGTTGAITLRQPFGGLGKSALGPGIKAGGPHYVSQFMTFKELAPPPMATISQAHPLLALADRWQRKCRWGQMGPWSTDLQKCVRAIKSYLHYAQAEFLQTQDFFHLRGQENQLRYLPVGKVAVCVHAEDSLFEVVARIAAARIAGCETLLCLPPRLDNGVSDFLEAEEGRLILKDTLVMRRTPGEVADLLPTVQRLRFAAPERVPEVVYQAAARQGRYMARAPVLMDGRIELMHYFINQSICDSYHRYGNLGERGSVHDSD